MALDFDIIGVDSESVERSWTADDVALYAVAVGAGHDDATEELEFTTDNTAGVTPRALPTYANIVASRVGGAARYGTFDPASYVHAEQAFTLHRPLQTSGNVRATSRVVGMYDKGHAALVVSETRVVDAATEELWISTRSSIFIRGEGGFGGERGPKPAFELPSEPPDLEITYRTTPEQALLYRLTGDRNPLHSDPAFAQRGGYERPILHGLCTYGITGRLLLREVCGGDPAAVSGMQARFSGPVRPGDLLTVRAWVCGSDVLFSTHNRGAAVLDRGRLRLS